MNEPKRKRRRLLSTTSMAVILLTIVIGSGLVVIGFGLFWMVNVTLFVGVNPGPSLIEEMRRGAITESEIKSVEFLKQYVGYMAFTQKEYDSLPRKRISSAVAVRELIRLLSTASDGHKHRNHPATGYNTIIKVTLQDGGVYYVYCQLSYYEGAYYVYVDANSLGSVNPNGAKPYESIPLADFLKDHDPSYRDVLSN